MDRKIDVLAGPNASHFRTCILAERRPVGGILRRLSGRWSWGYSFVFNSGTRTPTLRKGNCLEYVSPRGKAILVGDAKSQKEFELFRNQPEGYRRGVPFLRQWGFGWLSPCLLCIPRNVLWPPRIRGGFVLSYRWSSLGVGFGVFFSAVVSCP